MEKINKEDIKAGDIIRFEYEDNEFDIAKEYTAANDGQGFDYTRGQHYLMERIEEPFAPVWGTAIYNPEDPMEQAVYIKSPEEQEFSWLGYDSEDTSAHWFNKSWGQDKLNNYGWEVMENPNE